MMERCSVTAIALKTAVMRTVGFFNLCAPGWTAQYSGQHFPNVGFTHVAVCRLKCFCTNCMYMGIVDLLLDDFVLVGAVTKDVSLVRTLE